MTIKCDNLSKFEFYKFVFDQHLDVKANEILQTEAFHSFKNYRDDDIYYSYQQLVAEMYMGI